MSPQEIKDILKSLRLKKPCELLVFTHHYSNPNGWAQKDFFTGLPEVSTGTNSMLGEPLSLRELGGALPMMQG